VNLLRLAACAALLPTALALSGCRTGFVRRKVERRISQWLADTVGPADLYTVRIVDTRDSELVLGRARRVEIEGRGIQARNQFRIDALRLTLDDLRYNGAGPFSVSVQRSDLEVEFTDQALNDYLDAGEARYEPEIRFTPDQVHVRMVYPFLGVPTPISGSGRLVVQEGRKLLFDAEKVDVSFVDRPGFGEKFVEDRINPLLDLTRAEFPARLESVQVLEGRLRAHGVAVLPRDERD